MHTQGPSTSRERETLLLLREALPEYEINPHMRLANVVKGKLRYIPAMGQYEMDFVVMDPATGEVICAIELDDSTHDTEDGRRRDANKNRWMAQARIRLIRIRTPEEAITIRERMNRPIDFNIPNAITYPFLTRSRLNNDTKRLQGAALLIIVVVLSMWGLNAAVKGTLNSLGKKAELQQQQLHQQNVVRQAQARLQKQQELELAEARRRVEAQQRYERLLVKGKPLRECSTGNVIDNHAILCMKDHYEMVLVSGGQ